MQLNTNYVIIDVFRSKFFFTLILIFQLYIALRPGMTIRQLAAEMSCDPGNVQIKFYIISNK